MGSYILFVGSNEEYLSVKAKEFDPSATLLTSANEITDCGVYYTALGDIKTPRELSDICFNATKLFYCPPDVWKNKVQQRYTEEIVLASKRRTDVQENIIRDDQFVNSSALVDKRISETPQIWAVGCSITAGVGVSKSECWTSLVQKHINLPMSSLSKSGSSILWQSDQIIRSDIREGDIVLWGVTTNGRLPVIINEKLVHLSVGSKRNKITNLEAELLNSSSLRYHNILAIQRAVNFCKVAKAKIILVGVLPDCPLLFSYPDLPNYTQAVLSSTMFIDVGTDGAHPGPEQHQEYARLFIHAYNNYA